MSFDALQEKIRAKKNPTVAGLDPKPEQIPPHILKASYETYGETLQGAAEAVWTFNQGLIDALCDVVPAVKPQAAYYERLGWRGLEVMERTIAYAREKDLFVIADIKRGDIGSTAQAYADAWLGETRVGEASHPVFNADCVTLNGYMGSDTIEPFVEACKAGDKCLFLLVKTSNPGSGELQNMVAGDRLVYKVMGDMTAKLGKGTEGRYGFHLAGAVVGATYPSDMRELRRRLEHTFFLVPGYGAQGGTAEDVQYAFNKYGHGAIVNASRSIMCAWQKAGTDGTDFGEKAAEAAIKMKNDIGLYVRIM